VLTQVCTCFKKNVHRFLALECYFSNDVIHFSSLQVLFYLNTVVKNFYFVQ